MNGKIYVKKKSSSNINQKLFIFISKISFNFWEKM